MMNADRRTVVLYNPWADFGTMPLALLAIGSHLDPARYDVRIHDGRLSADPLPALLADLDGAVCLRVTVLTGQPIRDAMKITRAVKAARPDLPIVWGGWHPSMFATECFAEPAVDYTVQAQGEVTFSELVEALAEGRAEAGIAGSTSRVDGQPRRQPPRALADLNELRPHNYELIDTEAYFALKGKRQLDYISSQGCYFRCAFCADPFVYQRKWTALEPARNGRRAGALVAALAVRRRQLPGRDVLHPPGPGARHCRGVPPPRSPDLLGRHHARGPGRADG
ncbi:MAG: cobalamin-dependent protein [Gammaproteobacteria bacterium]|nr:cobalamin-dependent protein [Gammaproteobacteria bacterium]